VFPTFTIGVDNWPLDHSSTPAPPGIQVINADDWAIGGVGLADCFEECPIILSQKI
jgi:hypothetical protein